MKNNKICNNTFCAAPWFMVRNTNLGNYEICCLANSDSSKFKGKKDYYLNNDSLESWTNSEYLRYVRTTLASGNQISECDTCWKRESKNQTSLRQTYNQEILGNKNINQSWANNYFKFNNIDNFGFVVGADIKTSNVCNFACAMCDPRDSSLIASDWQQNLNDPYIESQLVNRPDYLIQIKNIYKEKSSYDLLDQIGEQSNLKFLKVLGGEPLLDKKLLNMLQNKKNKDQISLMIVTNGSVDIQNFVEQHNDYKFFYFTVSLEGYKEYNNYIRKKSDWQQISKNILNAKKLSKTRISVHSTIQALSFPSLINLITWCNQNEISWNFDVCRTPEHLSINALPKSYFNSQIKVIQKVDSELANYLISQYNDCSSTYKAKLLEYLEWYNKKDFTDFKNLYPDLYKFLISGN